MKIFQKLNKNQKENKTLLWNRIYKLRLKNFIIEDQVG